MLDLGEKENRDGMERNPLRERGYKWKRILLTGRLGSKDSSSSGSRGRVPVYHIATFALINFGLQTK